MNNLEKEFVPPKEAMEMKELGFNDTCFRYLDVSINEVLGLPTFSQAFRWFREKKMLAEQNEIEYINEIYSMIKETLAVKEEIEKL